VSRHAATGGARTVLVVDDDPDHRMLISRAVQTGVERGEVEVVTAGGGERALAYLRAEGPLPHLVLLDLKMPGVDGFAVLRAVRADPDLKGLPVIVLSSSDHPDDIMKSYREGTNCYLVKQTVFRRGRMADVLRFWFTTAVLANWTK
jgi:CheY-like chemotaxis protein